MYYRQLKNAVKVYYNSLPHNRRYHILNRSGICILSLNHLFKIFHCLECGGFIIQELLDGRWRIIYSEPGRGGEEILFISDDESEACEEFFRLIKKYHY